MVGAYAGLQFATWAQGFGDYERRDGVASTSINCCTGGIPGGLPIGLGIVTQSRATTGGFTGGVDVTTRNIWSDGDGIIVGALSGYLSTDLRIRAVILSSDITNVANGSSNVKVDVSGPTAGVYAIYFTPTFSADAMLKANFLDFNETFNDVLGFSANAGINPVAFPFAGGGSTSLNSYTALGNVNYRLGLAENLWLEPTAGVEYTHSSYGSGAFLLGLDDGELVKVQGGARLGLDSFVGTTRFTAVLTGLVYDYVHVQGGFIQSGALGTNLTALNDEGKVRGQGILTLNADYGNGVSAFVQGEVRGGEDLFGAGVKGGVRVVW